MQGACLQAGHLRDGSVDAQVGQRPGVLLEALGQALVAVTRRCQVCPVPCSRPPQQSATLPLQQLLPCIPH